MLATKGLVIADFPGVKEANAAADELIKEFQIQHPRLEGLHPTKLYPDMPMLDAFWFAEFTGILCSTSLKFLTSCKGYPSGFHAKILTF